MKCGKPHEKQSARTAWQRSCRRKRAVPNAQNLAVINLPPNKDGRLVGGDIENLMKLSKKLGTRRETADKNQRLPCVKG
jgi:transposase-like protein